MSGSDWNLKYFHNALKDKHKFKKNGARKEKGKGFVHENSACLETWTPFFAGNLIAVKYLFLSYSWLVSQTEGKCREYWISCLLHWKGHRVCLRLISLHLFLQKPSPLCRTHLYSFSLLSLLCAVMGKVPHIFWECVINELKQTH